MAKYIFGKRGSKPTAVVYCGEITTSTGYEREPSLRQYLLGRAEFITWCLRYPKMKNAKGMKHCFWWPNINLDLCMTPPLYKITSYQIWLGEKLHKYANLHWLFIFTSNEQKSGLVQLTHYYHTTNIHKWHCGTT